LLRQALPGQLGGPLPLWGVGLFLGLGGVVAAAALRFAPAKLTPGGDIEGTGPVVVEPRDWVGQPCPLLAHTDLGGQLAAGEWLVVLYHQDCPRCREEIAQHEELARRTAGDKGAPRIAFVEVPAQGAPSGVAGQTADGPWLYGRLSAGKEWFMQTPLVLSLREGRCRSVRLPEQESPLAQLFDKAPDRLPEVRMPADLPGPWKDLLSGAPLENRRPSFPNYREARRIYFLSEVACGPLSLLTVLKKFHVPLTEEDVQRVIAAAGTKGTDLLQLKNLAESFGLHAPGIEAPGPKLGEVGLPAIVHLHGVGFAAVTGYRPGALELIYPLKTPAWVSDEEFEQAFGNPGRALLLSREPLQARRLGVSDSPPTNPTGPVLRLEKNVLAVGQIHSPTFEGSLTLHNDGTEPLTIAEVKSSCPCIKAAVDRQTLPSKESATLRVKGDLDRFGRFHYEIVLFTNQMSAPTVKVAVRGFFEHPVFFDPPALALRDVYPNEQRDAEVPLEITGGRKAEDILVTVPKGAPLTARIQGEAGAFRLHFHWLGAPDVGMHHYQIQLRPRELAENFADSFFFGVEVVRRVEVFPRSLLFPERGDTGEPARSLTFESKDPAAIGGDGEVRWSNPRFAGRLQVAFSPGRAHLRRLLENDLRWSCAAGLVQ
jgi:hypothetical protein